MLPRQDSSNSGYRDEAHCLTVGDNENQWAGWPPGERYPLDEPEVTLRRVDAVPISVIQVRVEDGSSAGFEFAHHASETAEYSTLQLSGHGSISGAETRH